MHTHSMTHPVMTHPVTCWWWYREQLALNTVIAAAVTKLGPKLAPSSQSTSPELHFLTVKWAKGKTFRAPMAGTWEVFMSIDPLILAECWEDTPDLTSLGEVMRRHFGGWLDRGHAITLYVEGNTPHSHTHVPTHTLYTPSTNTWYAGVKASKVKASSVKASEICPAVTNASWRVVGYVSCHAPHPLRRSGE